MCLSLRSFPAKGYGGRRSRKKHQRAKKFSRDVKQEETSVAPIGNALIVGKDERSEGERDREEERGRERMRERFGPCFSVKRQPILHARLIGCGGIRLCTMCRCDK